MVLRIVIDAFILVGAVFALAGTLGVLKMPDTFCRMQASTCIPTLGVLCVCIGCIIYAIAVKGSVGDAVKIGVVGVMIVFTNPIGAHAIAKGAYKSGIRPEKPLQPDEYGRDFDD